jgi:hypothetical protein
LTEDQIKELGFELSKEFPHDQYHTKRYTKGSLEVEFTYEGEKLVSCELTITEIMCKPVTFEEIKVITPILGDWEW